MAAKPEKTAAKRTGATLPRCVVIAESASTALLYNQSNTVTTASESIFAVGWLGLGGGVGVGRGVRTGSRVWIRDRNGRVRAHPGHQPQP